jgi:hypothetical protein
MSLRKTQAGSVSEDTHLGLDLPTVDPETPLALDLVGELLSVEGPLYDIVARVIEHQQLGEYLDPGAVKIQPQHYFDSPAGTVVTCQSGASGRTGLFLQYVGSVSG